MEFQKKKNLLDNTPNQPSKFRTKNWVEINDDSRGMYNTNSQIKFKTKMLKLSLCDDSDACILVKRTITITVDTRPPAGRTAAEIKTARENDERFKGTIFKNFASFTDCMSEINNTQTDNAKNTDLVMPMYNLI